MKRCIVCHYPVYRGGNICDACANEMDDHAGLGWIVLVGVVGLALIIFSTVMWA